MKIKYLILLISFLVLLNTDLRMNFAREELNSWPKRVLITNDDGIEDVKMIELARAFSKIAETYVVAPLKDRSSSTNYISVFRKHALTVEKHQLGKGINAYAVDGFPGDCILLALKGLMRDNPPDLVISGINGGPNLGFDWLASGTIGAARIASYWGVPAIAVSGMKENIPGSLKAAVSWIVQLAKSDLVRQLKPKQYLTVSIPRIPPAKIKGVRIVERAGILLDFTFGYQTDKSTPEKTTWYLNRPKPITSVPFQSDASLYHKGYVIVVPMLADEHDYKLLSRLKNQTESLPKWR